MPTEIQSEINNFLHDSYKNPIDSPRGFYRNPPGIHMRSAEVPRGILKASLTNPPRILESEDEREDGDESEE